jgi:anti-anti-sigma factor
MNAADRRTGSRRLEVTRSTTGVGTVRLSLIGEVDIGTVDQLEAAITETLDEPGLQRLVLDFNLLRFLDSSGIAALVSAYRAADGRGIRFGLINCKGRVHRVLEVTGVYDTLAIDDEDAWT